MAISGSKSFLLDLNGVRHWMIARGEPNKPVLLFLHGGPGLPATGLIHGYQQVLEEHFLVVHYDQRGTGKSLSWKNIVGSWSINEMVEYAKELAVVLINMYKRDKIYLMGHSWGTLLGMKLIHRYPSYFEAFFSVSQFTCTERMEAISYQFALTRAREDKNPKATKDLEKIGEPLYESMGDIMIQRKWVNYFGGGLGRDGNRNILKIFVRNVKEYSILDKAKVVLGTLLSFKKFVKEINTVDLFAEIRKVEIPVFFFVGRDDYITPSGLVSLFYEQLEAPHKEFDLLPGAHDVIIMHSEQLQKAIIEKLGHI